jgi:hypothetical protein
VLRGLFGTDDVPFSFTSQEFNGVTTDNVGTVRPWKPRSYLRLSQAEQENGNSRLFLGIHWYYDRDSGIALGESIAPVAIQRYFTPIA